MLKKKIEDALNHQVLLEGESPHFYLAMASWAEVQGYSGKQDVTVAEAKTITQNQAQIRFCEFDYNGQCDSHSGNTVGNIVFEKGMIKKESQLKLFNPSQNLQAFTQPGTYNFRLPESINSIDVLVVAGGGGGGEPSRSAQMAAGCGMGSTKTVLAGWKME